MKKDSAENMVRVSTKPEKGYLTAVTEYTVLEKKGELALVEVLLHTGRSDQGTVFLPGLSAFGGRQVRHKLRKQGI